MKQWTALRGKKVRKELSKKAAGGARHYHNGNTFLGNEGLRASSNSVSAVDKKLPRRYFSYHCKWNECLAKTLSVGSRTHSTVLFALAFWSLFNLLRLYPTNVGQSPHLLHGTILLEERDVSYTIVFSFPPLETLMDQFASMTGPLIPPQSVLERQKYQIKPNYGDIEYTSVQDAKESGLGRVISRRDSNNYELYRSNLLADIEYDMSENYYPKEDLEDVQRECMDVEWTGKHFPTCNAIHETLLDRPKGVPYGQDHLVSYLRCVADGDNIDFKYCSIKVQWDPSLLWQSFSIPIVFVSLNEIIASWGSYREAWSCTRSDIVHESFVVKRYRLRPNHEWTIKDLSKAHTEAMVYEKLSSSPNIINLYGYCGTTHHTETMAADIFYDILAEGEEEGREGFASQAALDQLDDLYPQNNLTITEKLELSLSMAEALRDLHECEGGPIIHTDFHIEQFLLAPDGSLKLNDFNDAIVMQWDRRGNRYCPVTRHPFGVELSPEEYDGWPFDESVDKYTYGNNVYAILTGLFPFYNEQYHGVSKYKIRKKIVAGRRPFVDERYLTRSYIERQLVMVMRKCWNQDPNNRPSMSSVATYLRQVKAKAKELGELEDSDWLKIS